MVLHTATCRIAIPMDTHHLSCALCFHCIGQERHCTGHADHALTRGRLVAQALAAAAGAHARLTAEAEEGERARAAHLAWSGAALAANSVTLVDEALLQIRAAFLLPRRDLKCALREEAVVHGVQHPSLSCSLAGSILFQPELLKRFMGRDCIVYTYAQDHSPYTQP